LLRTTDVDYFVFLPSLAEFRCLSTGLQIYCYFVTLELFLIENLMHNNVVVKALFMKVLQTFEKLRG